jgi:dihydrofolate reductase
MSPPWTHEGTVPAEIPAKGEKEMPAAGDKDVSVAGGANTIQQYLKAGLLDEMQIHLVPVLLGDGIRLFDRLGAEHIEIEGTRVIESPRVTHLRFRVVDEVPPAR